MAKPRALVKRRKSIESIAKITKTMQMIATAGFQKAFGRAVAARPFTDALRTLVSEVSAGVQGFQHPLLERRTQKRVALLALASNRGLCGGYNAGVLRALEAARQEALGRDVAVELHVVGKRIGSMLRYRRVDVDRLHVKFTERPRFDAVDEIASEFLRRYEAGEIDGLTLVYTKFLSSARQTPVAEEALPIVLPTATTVPDRDYIFEPDPAALLSALLPRTVRMHVFQAFLDAAVSEQTARMVAMKSATDNANDMIRSLTRLYNRSRQAQITTELSEIMGGAAALE